ncbi:MAG: hypothetical protein PVH12_08445 [Candidatus Bathyarchaeota archaeon]|jgi:hypothetical protein
MWVKKKEMALAVILGVLIAFSAVYLDLKDNPTHFSVRDFLLMQTDSRSSEMSYDGEYQCSRVVSESIKGELERGAFERVIEELQILTEEMQGYVQSLRMTYQERFWRGLMICRVPQVNVTSFTFSARTIIEENGTITYINISIETVDQQETAEENEFTKIDFNLEEKKLEVENAHFLDSISPVFSVLTTSLLWIIKGLIIGIPLCFVSLGVLLLINRGIIPVWRNMLKKSE